jgi:chromosome segregation ATPase
VSIDWRYQMDMKERDDTIAALRAENERLKAEVEQARAERDLERESKANYDAAYMALSEDQQEYINRIEQYRSDNCYLEQRCLRLVRMLKEAGITGDYFSAACELTPSRVETQRWAHDANQRAEQAERERDEARVQRDAANQSREYLANGHDVLEAALAQARGQRDTLVEALREMATNYGGEEYARAALRACRVEVDSANQTPNP